MMSPDDPGEGPPARQAEDRAWMLPLLDLLFEDYTETAAIRLLRDDLAREAVTPLFVAALAERGIPAVNLETAAGDNLLQGLLALRVKFSHAEAREKVTRNIAMTGGGR